MNNFFNYYPLYRRTTPSSFIRMTVENGEEEKFVEELMTVFKDLTKEDISVVKRTKRFVQIVINRKELSEEYIRSHLTELQQLLYHEKPVAVRHNNGKIYDVIGTAFCATGDVNDLDVIYQDRKSGQKYTRIITEFTDGRFTIV